MHERVSVVPRRKLVEASIIPPKAASRDQGLFLPFDTNGTPSYEEVERVIMAERKGRRRLGVLGIEKRPTTMEQITTYGIIFDGESLLVQEKSHADPRLQHSTSIGVGGHLDQDDFFLKDCLEREFWEEKALVVNDQKVTENQVLEDFFTITPLGLIKDMRDAVGKRHVGVVFSMVPREGTHILPKVENGHRHELVKKEALLKQAEDGEVVLSGWADIILQQNVLPLVTPR